MKRKTVALIVIVALVIGLGAGLTVAALKAPEPTTVPAIVLESDSPTPSGNEPSGERKQGQRKKKVDRPSGDPTGKRSSTGRTQVEIGGGSGGAQPAPPPPPAPAGDDDAREDGGDDGADDGGDG